MAQVLSPGSTCTLLDIFQGNNVCFHYYSLHGKMRYWPFAFVLMPSLILLYKHLDLFRYLEETMTTEYMQIPILDLLKIIF